MMEATMSISNAYMLTKFLFNPSPSIVFLRNNTFKPKSKACLITASTAAVPSSSSPFAPPIASESFNQTVGVRLLSKADKKLCKKRVFFLDVNPLCYAGNKPSLQSFGHWVSLLFSQVSLTDPVIAVLDGERGSDYRRQLLPSYKAHRRKFFGRSKASQRFSRGHVGRSFQAIKDVLQNCNVPVIKIEGQEADDVVATLAGQVLQRGHRVVIASPDKDFKQLISENVQLVMPLADLERWSFYTLRHYVAQYSCDPQSDLSLTAVRTVGRQYAQEALTKYGDYLRRNYKVLALRRDVDVHIQEEWLVERDRSNDSVILSNFFKSLEEHQKLTHQSRSHISNGRVLKIS